MQQNTNISIVQLVKSGEIDVNFEISNLRAGKDINVSIKNFLKKSPDYKTLVEQVRNAENDLRNAPDSEKLFYSERLESIRKVEEDFVVNTLLLAKTFSNLEIRTERLRKSLELFEEGRIKEADEVLKEADLLNDQFNLIAYTEYLEKINKFLKNALTKNSNNFPKA
jgi:hypothetical protein